MAAAGELYIGIDVGGTSVKIGLLDAEGTILAKQSVPTPPLVDQAGYDTVTNGIAGVLSDHGCDVAALKGIGFAVPCPIPDDGDIKIVANMQLDLAGLKSALEVAYPGVSIKFLNDANAATLGELWCGSASGYRSLVFVTIGTGVGGGVVVDGKVVGGANGAGGEIGHICMNPAETRVCGCGRRGCLEQYASATGVVSNYLMECEKRGVTPIELTGPSDSKDVFQACREGDEVAWAAVETMSDYLGLALANIAGVVDPEAFVIGGGASASADVYLDKVREKYRSYVLSCSADTPIVVATLGNDAGMIGAAYGAREA